MKIKNAFLPLLFTLLVLLVLPVQASAPEGENPPEQVLILARHSIRAPLSGGGSVLDRCTDKAWIDFGAPAGELTAKGGLIGISLGQYMRRYLREQGFILEEEDLAKGSVRFYANAKQRTIATARAFAAGFLPLADLPVETACALDEKDDTFLPLLHFVNDDLYTDALEAGLAAAGAKEFEEVMEHLEEAMDLLCKVLGKDRSEAFPGGEHIYSLTEGEEPSLSGPLCDATSVVDALTLQLYEEPDYGAFKEKLSLEDWQLLHSIVDTYHTILFSNPLLCRDMASPLLREIKGELGAEGRLFTFLSGHDSTFFTLLASLEAEPYLLPDAVEQRVPIGSLLVFERFLKGEEAFYQISLVYADPEQLGTNLVLDEENAAKKVLLHFEGLPENEDGYIPEEALLGRIDEALARAEEIRKAYEDREKEAA